MKRRVPKIRPTKRPLRRRRRSLPVSPVRSRRFDARPLAWLAVLACVAGGAFLAGRYSAPVPEQIPAVPVALVETPPVAKPKPPPRRAPRRPVEMDAARVRAAVLARAGELGACARPVAAPPLVPTRLAVDRSGHVREVSFDLPKPMPPRFENCVRGKLMSWQLDGLELERRLEVLVTFGVSASG